MQKKKKKKVLLFVKEEVAEGVFWHVGIWLVSIFLLNSVAQIPFWEDGSLVPSLESHTIPWCPMLFHGVPHCSIPSHAMPHCSSHGIQGDIRKPTVAQGFKPPYSRAVEQTKSHNYFPPWLVLSAEILWGKKLT